MYLPFFFSLLAYFPFFFFRNGKTFFPAIQLVAYCNTRYNASKLSSHHMKHFDIETSKTNLLSISAIQRNAVRSTLVISKEQAVKYLNALLQRDSKKIDRSRVKELLDHILENVSTFCL
jgi:hypothetical protein